jgi:hypothetical protein
MPQLCENIPGFLYSLFWDWFKYFLNYNFLRLFYGSYSIYYYWSNNGETSEFTNDRDYEYYSEISNDLALQKNYVSSLNIFCKLFLKFWIVWFGYNNYWIKLIYYFYR